MPTTVFYLGPQATAARIDGTCQFGFRRVWGARSGVTMTYDRKRNVRRFEIILDGIYELRDAGSVQYYGVWGDEYTDLSWLCEGLQQSVKNLPEYRDQIYDDTWEEMREQWLMREPHSCDDCPHQPIDVEAIVLTSVDQL